MRSKRWGVVVVLMVMAMVLSGCGAEPMSFSGTSGITVTATDKWTQVTDQAGMQEIYADEVNQDLMDSVDLALKGPKGEFFTLEKYDCANDMNGVQEFVAMLKEEAANDEAGLLETLRSNEFTEEELALYQEAWQKDALTEEELAWLYQQISNLNWFGSLAQQATDFEMISSEEVTLMGQRSTLSEYKYTNQDGITLQFYEACVIYRGQYFTFNAWSGASDFGKQKDDLKALIMSAKNVE